MIDTEKFLSNRIKDILESKGWSQKELAEKTGLTEASICRYVKGERTPNAKNLIKIVKALSISCDYLLGVEVEHD